MRKRAPTRGDATRVALVSTVLALTVGGLAGCGSDEGSSRSFCAALRSAPTLESVVSGFTSIDRPELTRRLDRAGTAYATVERTAPDEVDDDVEVVVAVVDSVIEAVRDHDDDPGAAVAAVRAELAEQPDLDAATARVASYAKEECELDLNPGISTTADASTGTTASTDQPASTDTTIATTVSGD